MLRRILIDPKIIVLATIALLIRLFSGNEAAVEKYYATSFYPAFSGTYRLLLGWVPFSVGDLLYAAAAIYLVLAAASLVRQWRAGKPRRPLLVSAFRRVLVGALLVYVLFQVFWGLNYSRQGIAHQLQLDENFYDQPVLDTIAGALLQRLHATVLQVDTVQRERLHQMDYLEEKACGAYAEAARHHPFLTFRNPSLKASLYSPVGHLFGFTGYYNPFSGEAQLKTSIPVFLKPFVATHEMAHQLGYGKESEANFVAFLTCRHSPDPEVRYSVYFEMYLYTLSALRRFDSTVAKNYREAAPQRVQTDMQLLADYLERSRNPVEPYISWIYDAYLKRNNQPKGARSYNEVVVWLAAYTRKYGLQSL